jgi:hypothetical protein
MILFKKIRSKRTPGTGDIWLKVNSKWIANKQKIASFLQQRSESMSAESKKYCLILFCLVFGGSSLAVIVYSATSKEQIVSITKISKPAHAPENQRNYFPVDSFMTKQEYERVEQFKNYLLGLKRDPLSVKKFDSIMKERPQLIDSIHLFEKMYLQQP